MTIKEVNIKDIKPEQMLSVTLVDPDYGSRPLYLQVKDLNMFIQDIDPSTIYLAARRDPDIDFSDLYDYLSHIVEPRMDLDLDEWGVDLSNDLLDHVAECIREELGSLRYWWRPTNIRVVVDDVDARIEESVVSELEAEFKYLEEQTATISAALAAIKSKQLTPKDAIKRLQN